MRATTPIATDVEVIKAGTKLSDENKRVTGYSLKLALGSQGDAARFMKMWTRFTENASRGNDIPSVASPPSELPDEIATAYNQLRMGFVESLDGFARSIWSTADRRARVRLDEEMATAKQTQADYEKDQEDVANVVRLAELGQSEAAARADVFATEALEQRHRADLNEATVAVLTLLLTPSLERIRLTRSRRSRFTAMRGPRNPPYPLPG